MHTILTSSWSIRSIMHRVFVRAFSTTLSRSPRGAPPVSVAADAPAARPPRRVPRGVRSATYYPPPPEALTRGWEPPPSDVSDPHALHVAICGEPNAGKSTLLNALVGGLPVSAVSRKYNTTRDRTLGVYTEGPAQLSFTDTPGFVRPTASGARYHAALATAAREAIPASDVVLIVVDVARRMAPEALETMGDMVRLAAANAATVLVAANKCDLIRGQALSREQGDLLRARGGAPPRRGGRQPDVLDLKLLLLNEWLENACFAAGMLGPGGFDSPWTWVRAGDSEDGGGESGAPGSAAGDPWDAETRRDAAGVLWRRMPSVYANAPVAPLHALSAGVGSRDGVSALRTSLLRLALPRPWLYGARTLTDQSPAELVAEAVRARLYDRLHYEVPYACTQATRSWREVPCDGAGRPVFDGQGEGASGGGGDSPKAAAGRALAAALAAPSVAPAAALLSDTTEGWRAAWDAAAGGMTGGTAGGAAGSAAGGARGAAPSRGAASPAPPTRAVLVHQDIVVPSREVASMLLARGGAPIAAIARDAAEDASRLLNKRVLLQLHVAVKGVGRA